tara:strand:- start:87 stop:293 length:207 start_codon:yes stop_codon:yes gene_type:complete
MNKYFTYIKTGKNAGKIRKCTEAENKKRDAKCAKMAILFKAIELLCELDEKELAYQLRIAHDTHFLKR